MVICLFDAFAFGAWWWYFSYVRDGNDLVLLFLLDGLSAWGMLDDYWFNGL